MVRETVLMIERVVRAGRPVGISHLDVRKEDSNLKATYDMYARLAFRFVTRRLCQKFSTEGTPCHLPSTRALRCQGNTTVRLATSKKYCMLLS